MLDFTSCSQPSKKMTTKLTLHKIATTEIAQRSDGYVDANALCKASGKELKHYLQEPTTIAFLDQLSQKTATPLDSLIQHIDQGELQGTWANAYTVAHLAQWCDPLLTVEITGWMLNWYADKRLPIDVKIDIDMVITQIDRAINLVDIMQKSLQNEDDASKNSGYSIIATEIKSYLQYAQANLEGKVR